MVAVVKKKSMIIKKDKIFSSGKICLGAGNSVAPVRNTAESAPILASQAKVVENTAEYVVLELTCQCGTAMRLRCNYADITLPGLARHAD